MYCRRRVQRCSTLARAHILAQHFPFVSLPSTARSLALVCVSVPPAHIQHIDFTCTYLPVLLCRGHGAVNTILCPKSQAHRHGSCMQGPHSRSGGTSPNPSCYCPPSYACSGASGRGSGAARPQRKLSLAVRTRPNASASLALSGMPAHVGGVAWRGSAPLLPLRLKDTTPFLLWATFCTQKNRQHGIPYRSPNARCCCCTAPACEQALTTRLRSRALLHAPPQAHALSARSPSALRMPGSPGRRKGLVANSSPSLEGTVGMPCSVASSAASKEFVMAAARAGQSTWCVDSKGAHKAAALEKWESHVAGPHGTYSDGNAWPASASAAPRA